MVAIATKKLLRKLQEKGYTMLVSGKMTDQCVYFPEKGDPETIADNIHALPLEEDQAISIADALRWLSEEEIGRLCVITFQ